MNKEMKDILIAITGDTCFDQLFAAFGFNQSGYRL
jgi:hypothetical protein